MLDGNFLCCQMDSGQATVTLTFEERAALDQPPTTFQIDSGFEQFNPILTLEIDGQAIPEPVSIVLLATAWGAYEGRAWRRSVA